MAHRDELNEYSFWKYYLYRFATVVESNNGQDTSNYCNHLLFYFNAGHCFSTTYPAFSAASSRISQSAVQ